MHQEQEYKGKEMVHLCLPVFICSFLHLKLITCHCHSLPNIILFTFPWEGYVLGGNSVAKQTKKENMF